MDFAITIKRSRIERVKDFILRGPPERWVVVLALVLAVTATAYYFMHGDIVAYGDAESHLNIAKRVVDSLTPGFAQLGGVWLPMPHLLLIPFVIFTPLWKTGLAGSIVSGICFIVSALYLYKLVFLVTKNRLAAFAGSLTFMLNPNILYLQSTPMSELTLLVFFVLSSYYFIRHMERNGNLADLLLAAIFGFCAALSRYDGWFLIGVETGVLVLLNFPWKKIPHNFRQIKEYWDGEAYKKLEGKIVLFVTMAFFSIILWLGWCWLILGDPLYFINSNFSAKSQQLSWAARGELPSAHHIWSSFIYYFITTMSNGGVIVTAVAIIGLILYIRQKTDRRRFLVVLVLLAPFLFNIISLYLGQSVIFIPSLTPYTYDWTLFNVRYGVMMIPAIAFCCGYLFYKVGGWGKLLVMGLAVCQIGLFAIGYSPVITLQDGTQGLSSEIHQIPDAQNWIDTHYDGGLVLQDDFARTISIIKSPIPIKNTIYIGNKPFYEVSLKKPEKYATWIVMQQNDQIWDHLYADQAMQGVLYKYFIKVYTSPTILIFKRNPNVPDNT